MKIFRGVVRCCKFLNVISYTISILVCWGVDYNHWKSAVAKDYIYMLYIYMQIVRFLAQNEANLQCGLMARRSDREIFCHILGTAINQPVEPLHLV